jgi:two-component system, NarL family, sensor kinase
MFETEGQIKDLIVYATLVAMVFIAIIILFVVFYRRRRAIDRKEKENLTNAFKNELLRAKMEVQEATLQHFASELHDNIGQKLAVSRIYINRLEAAKAASGEKNELEAISQLMGDAINDLRTIANSLNPAKAAEMGLVKSLQNEAVRINQLTIVSCSVNVSGERQDMLNSQQELLLFRICQEFIQNSIRHAACSAICINLHFGNGVFTLQLTDNGKGFDYENVLQHSSGNGLKNIRNRARMLGGQIQVLSNNGTALTLTLPIATKENGQENHSDRR